MKVRTFDAIEGATLSGSVLALLFWVVFPEPKVWVIIVLIVIVLVELLMFKHLRTLLVREKK